MSINFQIDPDPDTIAWDFERNIRYEYYMMAEFVTNNQPINRASNFDELDASIPFIIPSSESISIEITINKFNIYDEDCICCICWEEKTDSQICQLNCNHKFCEACTLYYIKNNIQATCPLCREHITKITVQTQEIYEKFI